MSTPIKINTEGLQAILDAVNALPEAKKEKSFIANLKKIDLTVTTPQIANYVGDIEVEE